MLGQEDLDKESEFELWLELSDKFLSLPLRSRHAPSDTDRSVLEYRLLGAYRGRDSYWW